MKIEERVWVEDHILKVYRENPAINCLETFRIKFAEGTEAVLIDAETHEAERDAFGKVIHGLLVELGYDFDLDERYAVCAGLDSFGKLSFGLSTPRDDEPGTWIIFSEHASASDAIRAWLEVRGGGDEGVSNEREH